MTWMRRTGIDGRCACVGAVLLLGACGQTNETQTRAEDRRR